MLDLTSRDTLPKGDDGKVHLTLPDDELAMTPTLGMMNPLANVTGAEIPPNDYTLLLDLLRHDYYECCRYLVEPSFLEHGHYGDDCGDYRLAAAAFMAWLQNNFGWALWHSELDQSHIDALNNLLNCSDEDHCIHQYSLDGPNLKLDSLAIDWEHCPLLRPIG